MRQINQLPPTMTYFISMIPMNDSRKILSERNEVWRASTH
ncbi:hypothetical protein VIVU109784_17880 [Vibrio vulnificus]